MFCRIFCERRQIWVSEPHYGEVRVDARPWLVASWKAHGRLSIRLNPLKGRDVNWLHLAIQV